MTTLGLLLDQAIDIWMLYIAFGAAAGFVAGLLGIGGGLIAVPALVFIFQYQELFSENVMRMAVNTSLAIMIFTTTSVIIAQQRKQAIHWPQVKTSSLWLTAGTIMGICVSSRLSTTQLKALFSIFVIYISVRALIKRPRDSLPPLGNRVNAVIMSLIGFLSSMLGIGGGTLLVPLFLRHKLSIHQSIATSSACGLLIASIATITSCIFTFIKPTAGASDIHWPAVFGFVLGSIPFAPLGTAVAHRLPREVLRALFFVVVIVIYLTIVLF